MKTFRLKRLEDESGVSGTGWIAEGVIFAHGEVALCWLTQYRSVGLYPSIDELIAIHGHGGKTTVEYTGEISG